MSIFSQRSLRFVLGLSLLSPLGHTKIPTIFKDAKDQRFKNVKGTIFEPKSSRSSDWFNLDFQDDQIFGVSTEIVYKEFGMPQTEVIVAVIDSGVDVNHEDLQGKIWVNDGEISNNGLDDDNNGYVDDVFGWNFIGGQAGMASIIPAPNLPNGYSLIKGNPDHQIENDTLEVTRLLAAILKKEAAGIALTVAEKASKEKYQSYIRLNRGNYGPGAAYLFDTNFDPRPIVGDVYEDTENFNYGNNDVIGPDSSHGTHVAGIMAAVRGNLIGIDGISEKIKIMAIRVVPNGDERDKDVAAGIYYAVDNGASVINMSFGKSFSAYKPVVDEAVRYAQSRGVLLVHAAGNDGKDNDTSDNFPNQVMANGEVASNWLEVGASTKKGGPASFSNYGQTAVQVFAPGAGIKSTVPNNEYDVFSGTSMASPVVAGVAALAFSYFPNLTPKEIVNNFIDHSVKVPALIDRCVSEGVVNAFNSIDHF